MIRVVIFLVLVGIFAIRARAWHNGLSRQRITSDRRLRDDGSFGSAPHESKRRQAFERAPRQMHLRSGQPCVGAPETSMEPHERGDVHVDRFDRHR